MKSFLLKLSITTIALWLAFRQVTWQDLQTAYEQQEKMLLVAALCTILLQTICGALRWHEIRKSLDPVHSDDPTHTTLLYYASTFFNTCFPSTIGSDVARVWLAKRDGGQLQHHLYGVIVDRILSLVGMALLVLANGVFIFYYLELPLWLGALIGIAGWVAIITSYFAMRGLLAKISQWQLPHFIKEVIHALQAMTGRHKTMIRATLWAMAAHVMYASTVYALAMSMRLDISWFACVVLAPTVLLISILPITLGGWGVREFGMTTIFAYAGVSHTHALLLSIQVGLVTMLVSLCGGLVYLLLRRK